MRKVSPTTQVINNAVLLQIRLPNKEIFYVYKLPEQEKNCLCFETCSSKTLEMHRVAWEPLAVIHFWSQTTSFSVPNRANGKCSNSGPLHIAKQSGLVKHQEDNYTSKRTYSLEEVNGQVSSNSSLRSSFSLFFLWQRPREDSEEKDKILRDSLPCVAQGAHDYRWVCGGYRACRGAMINLHLKTVQSSSHKSSHI